MWVRMSMCECVFKSMYERVCVREKTVCVKMRVCVVCSLVLIGDKQEKNGFHLFAGVLLRKWPNRAAIYSRCRRPGATETVSAPENLWLFTQTKVKGAQGRRLLGACSVATKVELGMDNDQLQRSSKTRKRGLFLMTA